MMTSGSDLHVDPARTTTAARAEARGHCQARAGGGNASVMATACRCRHRASWLRGRMGWDAGPHANRAAGRVQSVREELRAMVFGAFFGGFAAAGLLFVLFWWLLFTSPNAGAMVDGTFRPYHQDASGYVILIGACCCSSAVSAAWAGAGGGSVAAGSYSRTEDHDALEAWGQRVQRGLGDGCLRLLGHPAGRSPGPGGRAGRECVGDAWSPCATATGRQLGTEILNRMKDGILAPRRLSFRAATWVSFKSPSEADWQDSQSVLDKEKGHAGARERHRLWGSEVGGFRRGRKAFTGGTPD
jgi:hypothetical protein